MKKMLKTLTILLVLVILGINSQVYAATTTIKANNVTVNVGDEITVTATVTAAQWDLKIKLNGKILAESSELENYESNITKTITAKYKTTEKGKLDFILEGDITDVNQENKTVNDKVSVTVNEPTPPPTNNNSGTSGSTTTTTTPTEKPAEKPAEVKKSTEARLSKLGIKVKKQKNDFSGFKKDTYQYSTTVANDVSEVEIYAEKADSKATVKGTGKVSLKEGDNKFEVKVTAEDGKTTKTYKITIKRKTVEEEDAENGEARLKTLGIKPKEYDFTGFNSDTTEYTAKVPNEIKEIEIFATAKDSRAQITGIGVVELKEGINDLKIEVIAVNGEKNIYNLKVTREEPEVPFGLSTLNIDGLKLTPSFEVDTYEYNVELKEDLAKLEIQAKSNDEDATVEIIGNEELKDGENVITIQVRNKEKNKIATYQIIVNKNVIVEEVVAQTSWLKPSTWGKEEIFKLAIILVLIVLIICAILLKISIGKENKKTKKVDFPGGEELDKAIAEHQELSEEPAQVEYIEEKVPEINYQAEVQKEEIQQNYIEEIAMNRFEEKDLEKKTRRRGRHF